MYSKAYSRKISKREYPKLKPCEKCGSKKFIHRHHDDYQKPLEINFLCRKCHVARHKERGDWGHGKGTEKTCPNCFTKFIAKHSKNNRTCGNKICIKQICSLAAKARWKHE